MKRITVALVLSLGLGVVACGGDSSPNVNSPTPTPPTVNTPSVAPGFTAIEIPPVNGAPSTTTIYPIASDPGMNGILTMGREATLTVEMRGPAGWEAYTAAVPIPFGGTGDRCTKPGGYGAGFRLGTGSDGPSTSKYMPTGDGIEKVLFLVWISKSNPAVRSSTECADFALPVDVRWHVAQQ